MSLGLVAYGSSDESDVEEEIAGSSNLVVCKSEENINKTSESERCAANKNKEFSLISSSVINDIKNADAGRNSLCGVALNGGSGELNDDDDISSSSANVNEVGNAEERTLFSLPAPKTNKLHDIDFDWRSLSSRKSNLPIKISVPSLTDLDSEEASEPVKKKIKKSKTGSGLFALLPSPKNSFIKQTTSLKPQQISSKVKPVQQSKRTSVNKLTPNSRQNNLQSKSSSLSAYYEDSPDEDETNEDNQKVDFFSLSSSVEVPESKIHVPEHIDKLISTVENKGSTNKLQQKTHEAVWSSSDQNLVKDSVANPVLPSNLNIPAAATSFAPLSESYIPVQMEETEERDLELDETALQQLCGRRERHTGGSSVQLIDVKGDAILPDAREWMTKQLTEEQNMTIHSHKKKDGPTTQQRRKHQITYLAFQAKEHELELKNQWANNRMSRKQTQAKYGF